jgi:hypothetical protein
LQSFITQHLFLSRRFFWIFLSQNLFAWYKGIALATGVIIGTLNADDFFSNDNILIDVATAFADQKNNILYGGLDDIKPGRKITRKWRSEKNIEPVALVDAGCLRVLYSIAKKYYLKNWMFINSIVAVPLMRADAQIQAF